MKRYVLGLVLFAAIAPLRPAMAQMTTEARCQNATSGLVIGMQTARETGWTREVALETAGLAPGGPRYRIADAAYRQLAAGAPLQRILDQARAECRRIGPEALEDDESTFDDSREAGGRGGGAQLCADVADNIAALLAEEPAVRTMPIDEALRELRNSDPRDIAWPVQRDLLAQAQRQARIQADELSLQRFVYGRCTALDTATREALDREFYVP